MKAALLSESRIAFDDLGDRELFEDKVLEDKYFLWYEMVRDYTRRKLSHDSDRLLAVAGLAETFSKRVQSTWLESGRTSLGDCSGKACIEN